MGFRDSLNCRIYIKKEKTEYKPPKAFPFYVLEIYRL